MPLYEYICKLCGTTFEKLVVRISDDIESPECPKCRHKECVKLPSVFSSSSSCQPPAGGGFS
jgi:putative FmdB family regulatory protein